MARKFGYDSLDFEKIGKKAFDSYVSAVQKAARKDYEEMIEFIRHYPKTAIEKFFENFDQYNNQPLTFKFGIIKAI